MIQNTNLTDIDASSDLLDIFAAHLETLHFGSDAGDLSILSSTGAGTLVFGRYEVLIFPATDIQPVEDFYQDIFDDGIGSIQDWFGFAQAVYNALGTPLPGSLTDNDLFAHFFGEFLASQGINLDDVATNIGDYEPLLPGGVNRRDFMVDLFVENFNFFWQNSDFEEVRTGPPIGSNNNQRIRDFHDQWNSFIGTSNLLSSNEVDFSFLVPTGPFFSSTVNAGPLGNLNAYRDLYFAFVPGANQAAFEARLQTFLSDIRTEFEFFNAGMFAGRWFEAVLVEQLNVTFGTTAVDGNGSEQAAIIFRLFRLLTELLGVLQDVAAAQAERLTFLANAQRAYTQLLQEVPVIGIDRVDAFTTGIGSDNENAVQQSIQARSQAYTEKLRAQRSLFSDEARSHQTSVNQSNETVNQQANLATALLQQVSTILQGIFR